MFSLNEKTRYRKGALRLWYSLSPERGNKAQILSASPMKNGTTEDFLPLVNARRIIEIKIVQKMNQNFLIFPNDKSFECSNNKVSWLGKLVRLDTSGFVG